MSGKWIYHKNGILLYPEERSVCRYDERDNRVLRRMLFLRVYCPVGRLFFSAFSLGCDVFLNHTVILFSLSIL